VDPTAEKEKANDMAEVAITEGHDGGIVPARVGDSITLKLAETPATGFRWELGSVESQVLALTRDEFQPASLGIGGGGLRVFHFIAKKPGTAGLELRLARSWESAPPKSVFRVRIAVSLS
jgi:predicted secreted protein